MGRFPGAASAPRTGCAPTGPFLHSPPPRGSCVPSHVCSEPPFLLMVAGCGEEL